MHGSKAPKIMIAEESVDTREVLGYWLEMNGCCVVEAATGIQAVELTLRECPDLILMSERLPQLGGLGATRRIRELRNDCALPIVAMSTYPTKEAHASALAAGCAFLIAQPVDFDVLSSLLIRLLPNSTIEYSPPSDPHLDRKASRQDKSQRPIQRVH
jgi:CheY-like chemotaxis protein